MERRKNLIIRVAQDFGKKIKIKCAADGITQQEYIVKLIEANLKRSERKKTNNNPTTDNN